MIQRKPLRQYLLLHLIILILCCLFPLYRLISAHLPQRFSGCLMHDFLFLYCPMCGGTRAVGALLHFRFAEAFAYNPYIVLAFFLFLFFDILAAVRLLRGKNALWKIPAFVWITMAVLLAVYAVMRNVAMIAWGYDPCGDLGAFWRAFGK